jgi:hypothetical protein
VLKLEAGLHTVCVIESKSVLVFRYTYTALKDDTNKSSRS